MMKKIEWVLRIGVAGTFLGHGVFALLGKLSWLPYLEIVGISGPGAIDVLRVIGVVDILVALSVLIKPLKPILLWAVFWALATALARPLAGQPIWDFIERSANWATPLALYLLNRKNNR